MDIKNKAAFIILMKSSLEAVTKEGKKVAEIAISTQASNSYVLYMKDFLAR